MNYYNDAYPTPGGILIAEFGFNPLFEANMTLDQIRFDTLRSLYYAESAVQMVKAKNEDGVQLIGATGWSMMDNNEWRSYGERYGLQHVNRTTMQRTFKRNMFDFVGFFSSRIGKWRLLTVSIRVAREMKMNGRNNSVIVPRRSTREEVSGERHGTVGRQMC